MAAKERIMSDEEYLKHRDKENANKALPPLLRIIDDAQSEYSREVGKDAANPLITEAGDFETAYDEKNKTTWTWCVSRVWELVAGWKYAFGSVRIMPVEHLFAPCNQMDEMFGGRFTRESQTVEIYRPLIIMPVPLHDNYKPFVVNGWPQVMRAQREKLEALPVLFFTKEFELDCRAAKVVNGNMAMLTQWLIVHEPHCIADSVQTLPCPFCHKDPEAAQPV
jgi:hypothetical protein